MACRKQQSQLTFVMWYLQLVTGPPVAVWLSSWWNFSKRKEQKQNTKVWVKIRLPCFFFFFCVTVTNINPSRIDGLSKTRLKAGLRQTIHTQVQRSQQSNKRIKEELIGWGDARSRARLTRLTAQWRTPGEGGRVYTYRNRRTEEQRETQGKRKVLNRPVSVFK